MSCSLQPTGFKLYLAPMRGLTDAVFRSVLAELCGGFDLAVAPFIKTVSGGLRPNTLNDLAPERNRSLRVIPQLLTKHSGDFVAAASTLSDLGYEEINWNLGCPYGTVTKKGMGAGLLPHSEQIAALLDQVCKIPRMSISVKARLGFRDPSELSTLIPVFNQYPLKSLTIHPRTADQMYEGPINTDALTTCLSLSQIPIVYSGEIWTTSQFEHRVSRFPSIQHWMIGRGAIADPYIGARIKSSSLESFGTERYRHFHNELYHRYRNTLDGPGHLLTKMQGIWLYLGEALGAQKKLIKKIKKSRNLPEYEETVNRIFDSL